MHSSLFLNRPGDNLPFRISLLFAVLIPVATLAQELKVTTWAGAEEFAMEQANCEAFRRAHPGVTFSLETIPIRYKEKLLASFAAGTAPDVLLLDAGIVPTFVDRHLLVNLRPYAHQLNVNLRDFYPNVLQIAARGDSLFAFPKDFTPMVVYYNRKLFDQFGIAYPDTDWTWDDFLVKAQALTRDTDGDGRIDHYGTVVFSDLYVWQPWVWINGGDVLDPNGVRATGYLDSPQTLEALQFLIDLRNRDHVTPPEVYTAQAGMAGLARGVFISGKMGMYMSGHWDIPRFRDAVRQGLLDLGIAPYPRPRHGKRVTVMYEAGWAVSKTSKHRETAIQLAAYLASPEANRRRMAQGLAIPANPSLKDEVLRQDDLGIEAEFYREVRYCRVPWGSKVEAFSTVENYARDAFEEVMIGKRDLREAFSEAARKIDEALKAQATKKTSALGRFFLHLGERVGSSKGSEAQAKVQMLGFVLVETVLSLILIAMLIAFSEKRRRRKVIQGVMFAGPSFVHLMLFTFGPILFALYLAFHEWSVISPETPFVGLGNFRVLFHDRLFWSALGNTALYSLNVPVGMACALGVAVLLNQKIKGRDLLRTLFFLPSISSFVAVAIVWRWVYNTDYGLMNYFLGLIGIGPIPWLSDPRFALPALMILAIWVGMGYQMVIFLAGLESIPEVFYEAAIMDGANAWQRFWRVTLPLLKPTSFFVLVTSVIGSFQVFTPVYVMTQGGPNRATDVAIFHIYQSAWDYLKMGYASAMAWVLFLVILGVTLLHFRFFGRRVEYA